MIICLSFSHDMRIKDVKCEIKSLAENHIVKLNAASYKTHRRNKHKNCHQNVQSYDNESELYTVNVVLLGANE